MLSLEAVSEYASIVSSIVTALAAIGALCWYIFITGGLNRHTELSAVATLVHQNKKQKLVEISIKISNKGRERLKIYNILISVHALNDIDSKISIVELKNLIEEETEEWVRLPSGTDYVVNEYITLDIGVKIVDIELIVPYENRRLKDDDNFKKFLEEGEFNSIRKLMAL